MRLFGHGHGHGIITFIIIYRLLYIRSMATVDILMMPFYGSFVVNPVLSETMVLYHTQYRDRPLYLKGAGGGEICYHFAWLHRRFWVYFPALIAKLQGTHFCRSFGGNMLHSHFSSIESII